MGMGSSQARLLALTSRNHDIGRQLQHLSLEKTSLTREMQSISKQYNLALQGKVLKWSNNGGANYVDLTYNTLMRPGSANNNKPVLLTNNNGRVVLDSKYKEYAEMISPNGNSIGDWMSNENRPAIISKLTGIPADTIRTAAENTKNIEKLENNLETLWNNCHQDLKTEDFIKKMGTIKGHHYNGGDNNVHGDLYDYCLKNYVKEYDYYGGHWALGTTVDAAKTGLRDILNQITQNLSTSLTPEDLESFKKACNDTYTTYSGQIEGAEENVGHLSTVTHDTDTANGGNNNYNIRVYDMLSVLMENYATYSGQGTLDNDGFYNFNPKSNSKVMTTVDTNSQEYKRYAAAKKELETAKDNNSQLFTAEQEAKIAFYDQLFTAIAENGWTCDYSVNDTEYLNQMLQNNEYYITTMSEYDECETCNANGERRTDVNSYFYDTDLASNYENIFAVNDEYVRQEALVDYEYQKSIINDKESKIDERMKNLETEQQAINQMIQGIEQVKSDNIETYFSIFT